MKTTIQISGMHCKSCEALIKDALESVAGVAHVTADNKKGEAVLTHSGADMNAVKQAIQKLGYKG